jgi:hypothetical protein
MVILLAWGTGGRDVTLNTNQELPRPLSELDDITGDRSS